MNFDQSYNRHEFVSFLRQDFLPEDDFIQEETPVAFPIQTQYCYEVTRLGSSKSLDLDVYEIRHHSKSDARVGMSKEAFRLLYAEGKQCDLVIFVPENSTDNYRFSFIEITLHQDEDSSRVKKTYSNPRRYSYYLGKGVAWHTPNKYLNKKNRVTSIEDLRNRFSVEVLTKSFYQELSDWYAWAIDEIRFPNKLDNSLVNKQANAEGAIRLITRLIFVWFLKQKELIPNDFFDENIISEPIEDNAAYQESPFINDKPPVVPVYPAGSEELGDDNGTDFKQGDTVSHPRYGRGVIEKIIKYGNKTLCSIAFDNVGRRLLDPSISELSKEG